jgi:hypothetical protein
MTEFSNPTPGSLHQLACSDDSLLVSGVPKAHIEILAKAGVTTYFMVGTSGGSPGGNFIFNAQRPLTIKSVPDANNNVTKEGVATVSGTLFCSRPIPEQVYVTLTQTFARLTAFGSNSSSGFACSPEGSRWTVELSSFPVAFGGGTAILSVQPTNQCDSQGCQPGALIGLGYSASFSSKIKLNRGK